MALHIPKNRRSWITWLGLVCMGTYAHATPPTTDIHGEWLCHATGPAHASPSSHYVSIDLGVLQTDTIDADMQLTPAGHRRYTGTWITPTQTAASPQRQLELLTPDTLRYTDSPSNSTGHTTSGTCQRLGDIAQATPHPSPPAWQFIQLQQARPTQPALGYDQIYAKQARYRDTQAGSTEWKKAFADWCEISGLGGVRKKTVQAASNLRQPDSFACQKTPTQRDVQTLKTAVLAPNGEIYMTDGHHSLSSLWEAPQRQGDDQFGKVEGDITIPVRIQADYRHLNNASFWRAMRAQGYTWLQNPDGKAITPAALPQQFGLSQGFQDDPYRSLVYFTRGVGHQVPDDAPEFTEFHWAKWLQDAPRHFDLGRYQLNQLGQGNGSDHGYLQAVRDASLLMTRSPGHAIIGDSGRTAQQMGRLASLNTPALQQLVRKDKGTGKLAQALRYRDQLATPQTP